MANHFGKICAKHPELHGERSKPNYRCRACSITASASYRWKKKGINVTQARLAFETHDGMCGICKTTTPDKKDWNIDHCHRTGNVRGILCGKCNKGLGLLGDDLIGIQNAQEYLLRFYK